ncbi:MAG TPA: xanthine dehydrogenase family protein molybdopterin-binding subunit [Verrucomicrobiae bacterium]|jgi:isoquinoline 1-oxidoreductase beta subunit|nr:xanthine dehydrogenase family protein molybdopterin-binding subunit [Verrucomicrobiae bacterium]
MANASAPNLSMVSRRTFLRVSAAAAGGLLVSLYLDRPAIAQQPPKPQLYPPDAFVHVRPDGKIVIQVNRLEFGQGVQTALPMLLADEMDADWSQVVAELAPAADIYRDPLLGLQIVGGSGSIAHSFEQYRQLGARTRAMLVSAAAAQWKIDPGQCRTEASMVYGPNRQAAKYAELAAAAARLPIPENVPLKKASDLRLAGKKVRRLDSHAKCDGSQKYGLDVDLPGMKVALVAHPPVFGAKVKSFDARAARRIPGVLDVFEIPLVRGTGVAVVADRFWAAKQARDRLRADWDTASLERADTAQLFAKYHELSGTPGKVAASRGDAKVIDTIPAANRIVAEYEFPFLAHTPMEPLNTTIRFDGDRAEVWAGSQLQGVDQSAVAETLGLKPEQVTFHTEMTGGGFGRRAVPDSHVQREAAMIAKRLRGTPVKLIWTREDDVQGGYYRPMHVHRVEVGIGADGKPVAWRHVIVGQSIIAGTFFESLGIKDGVDSTAVEGAADTQYTVPHFHVSVHHPVINVPVLWFRSVGHSHNAFVMETLIDELATRANADPFAYRQSLLGPDAKKRKACLALLQEKTASWRNRVPRDHAVGIACHESFETAVACAVEVSIEDSRPRIHRATIAVDPGFAVNPLTIESQMQGGVSFGITQLVPRGAITVKDGRVEQRNWDGYTPPYIKDAPVTVDVHIVPSNEKPSGCGEPPVPVISPAIVNALSRLTGKRYRRLPLTEI